jgi:hypothetical protein
VIATFMGSRNVRAELGPRRSGGSDAVLRVSQLLELCPEIQELELKPLKVLPHGARAVDVRVRVGRSPARPADRRIAY